ncbi:MAG: extracellular solute-binding protein [Pseudomonadota bacterium]
MTLTRRALLAGASVALVSRPRIAFSDSSAHGFSPLGALKYGPGEPFDYVNPNAPKGGTLRLKTMRAFDTANTLRYPGRPPADLRIIYDRLAVPSEDEPASFYGLLAEHISVAEDFSAARFQLRAEARWHDGHPITADDVAFTLNTLKTEGAPFYRQAFAPLTVVVEGRRDIVITNARRGDRDLLRKIATIPIHPARHWKEGMPQTVVGSGPYKVALLDPPGRIILTRVQDYWGVSLGPNRGRWNFDQLVVTLYRDEASGFQAFTAGDIDVHRERDASRWETGYRGAWFETGDVLRRESDAPGVGTLLGLVMNTRRAPLGDRRVRHALALAFDEERAATDLLAGGVKPFASVFAGTPLAASGEASQEERALLGEAAANGPADPFEGAPKRGTREALRMASTLLDEAALPLVDGTRRDASGRPLTFEVLVTRLEAEPALSWYTTALRRLGIQLTLVRGDNALLGRRMLDRDFDLATLSWAPAQLPGTAERLLWHGALADNPGSYALSGIDDGPLNRAIEALEAARSREALAVAGRAFDRAFRNLHLMVPLWRTDTVRIAWWDRFGRPDGDDVNVAPSPMDRWWRTG